VINDVNMAPADILAALVPLLERRILVLSSRGEVLEAAPSFQLLATITCAPGSGGDMSRVQTSSGAYGSSQMVKVRMLELTRLCSLTHNTKYSICIPHPPPFV
jgi:midasin